MRYAVFPEKTGRYLCNLLIRIALQAIIPGRETLLWLSQKNVEIASFDEFPKQAGVVMSTAAESIVTKDVAVK